MCVCACVCVLKSSCFFGVWVWNSAYFSPTPCAVNIHRLSKIFFFQYELDIILHCYNSRSPCLSAVSPSPPWPALPPRTWPAHSHHHSLCSCTKKLHHLVYLSRVKDRMASQHSGKPFALNPFHALRMSHDVTGKGDFHLLIQGCATSCLYSSFMSILMTNEISQSNNFGQRNLYLQLFLEGSCTQNTKLLAVKGLPLKVSAYCLWLTVLLS